MSSIGELIAQLAAEKQRADELEAEIARSNALADEMVEQLTAIGFDAKAAQINEAKTRAGQAQNSRWLAEGHLEDAIRVLQAVLDGQKGVGTKIPGGAATAGASGAAPAAAEAEKPSHGPIAQSEEKIDFTYDLDGEPLPVTIILDKERTTGPSGKDLLEQESERRGSFARVTRAAVRRFDDLADGGKSITSTQYDAARAPNSPPTQTNTITVQQDDTPQFSAQPRQDVNAGDAASATLALAVFGLAAVASRREARQRERERRNDR